MMNSSAVPVAVPAVLLSTLGVVITAGITGVFAHFVLGFDWIGGLLLGLSLIHISRVAGSTVDPVSLPESACVACETACDAGELSELLTQVKKSFETYRRVVADGGLFCAFGSGSPHGICRGSSYLDYDSRLDEDVLVGEYDGATRHDAVSYTHLIDRKERNPHPAD